MIFSKNLVLILFMILIFSIFLIIACENNKAPTEPQNEPPTASFSVSPGSDTTGAIFSFDASTCSDIEDPLSELQVRWDWENDGTWDTQYSTDRIVNYRNNTEGIKTIILKVKDTGDLTATITHSVLSERYLSIL